MQDYRSINKDLWDKWAQLHLNAEFYDTDSFKKGENTLKSTELSLLGNIKGRSILHLQCHFGQDTLSLARMGADVTGIDMSEKGIEIAQELAAELHLPARFVCSNVLELDENLKGQFDIVYTSYGTISWLPDLQQWGKIVNHFLKPGGKFVMVEFHPLLNMYGDRSHFKDIKYGYFKTDVVIEDEIGSYGDPSATEVKGRSATWDYSLSEVIMALRAQGLTIDQFYEYDFSHYDIFEDSVVTEKGYQIKGFEGKLPLMFALVAKTKISA
ncbi:MAG: class I SAM-dependent methyltransferase [Bacteroidetes bacterium]|nr:class I SAM-dependent methyltransferase [Bacteroidota bacterium]